MLLGETTFIRDRMSHGRNGIIKPSLPQSLRGMGLEIILEDLVWAKLMNHCAQVVRVLPLFGQILGDRTGHNAMLLFKWQGYVFHPKTVPCQKSSIGLSVCRCGYGTTLTHFFITLLHLNLFLIFYWQGEFFVLKPSFSWEIAGVSVYN